MINELGFNKDMQELYDLMSEISEDCWCAGWLIGNEFALWSAIQRGDLKYGPELIEKADLDRCAELSRLINGWIVWLDDEHGLPPAEWGPYFVSMPEWLDIYSGFYREKI